MLEKVKFTATHLMEERDIVMNGKEIHGVKMHLPDGGWLELCFHDGSAQLMSNRSIAVRPRATNTCEIDLIC